MNDSPAQRVLYQDQPPSPVQAVFYRGETEDGHNITTPQRKPQKRGYKRTTRPAPSELPPFKRSNIEHNSLSTTSSASPDLVPPVVVTPSPAGTSPISTPLRRTGLSIPSPSARSLQSASPAAQTPVDFPHVFPSPGFRQQSLQVERYISFVEAVLADDCSMYQLDQTLFIVNGWNPASLEAHGWYHLQRTCHGSNVSIVCMCPEYRNDDFCLHSQFLLDYGQEKFPADNRIQDCHRAPILFSRVEDLLLEDNFINYFSVPSHGDRVTIKSRVVVEHRGDDEGNGSWKCVKDSTAVSCGHITLARNTLRRILSGDPTATDPNAANGASAIANTPTRGAAGVMESISYMALPAPIWARIQADLHAAQPPLMRNVPSVIPLEASSSCPCKEDRHFYDSACPIERRKAAVYGVLDACETTIEVQKCPGCKHGFIGPDASNYGVFNFNNRSLFAITLLDDYTAHFTKSETPFVSWVAATSCRYQNHQSRFPFIKEKVFRSAWFSYARLLQLNLDMHCPKCGLTPKVTIWDGVTLSFSRRNLLATLKPPTNVDEDSELKSTIKLETGMQLITDRSLRKDIATVLQGPTLELPRVPLESDESCPAQSTVVMMERIGMIPSTTAKLETIDPSLSQAFEKWFGTRLLFAGSKPHAVHKELFLQISAEESALQFMNGRSIHQLEQFIKQPSTENLPLLRYCPAIQSTVKLDVEQFGSTSSETYQLLKWIWIRSTVVLARLKKYGYPRLSQLDMGSNWRQTGACYGMPQVRKRSKYPGIPRDNAADLGGTDLRGEGCQKFYSTYGENRLTGGLMCVWCPHSICYGFHIIPYAEGRNDVFSAIYAHWETAPEVIVYDFACALQPYCMIREPEFFSNTLFVIDAFHAKGHTKCGNASFLTNYLETNPELIMVNSSAGECGNSGILRIRKSVSYMSQDRVIVYTKVFLSIWNRQRIRRLQGLV